MTGLVETLEVCLMLTNRQLHWLVLVFHSVANIHTVEHFFLLHNGNGLTGNANQSLQMVALPVFRCL